MFTIIFQEMKVECFEKHNIIKDCIIYKDLFDKRIRDYADYNSNTTNFKKEVKNKFLEYYIKYTRIMEEQINKRDKYDDKLVLSNRKNILDDIFNRLNNFKKITSDILLLYKSLDIDFIYVVSINDKDDYYIFYNLTKNESQYITKTDYENSN